MSRVWQTDGTTVTVEGGPEYQPVEHDYFEDESDFDFEDDLLDEELEDELLLDDSWLSNLMAIRLEELGAPWEW